jgi:hypothetical protein
MNRFLADRGERLVPRYARPALPQSFSVPAPQAPDRTVAADASNLRASAAFSLACPDPTHGQAATDAPPASVETAPGLGHALPGAVLVSDPVMILLGAIAAHEAVSIQALVASLATARARQIGLGVLARAALDHPSVRHADFHAAHNEAGHGKRHANCDERDLQGFASRDVSADGDLADLPDFERTASSRYPRGGRK